MNKLVACFLGIITLCLIGSIIYLNILNFTLLLGVIIIILIFSGLSILLTLRGRIKKVGFGLSILLIIIFSILIFYLNKTSGLLNSINLNYKTYNYSVMVLKDSSYKKLKDINGLELGYYNDGSRENEKALNKVLGKIDGDGIGYEDTHTLALALLNEEVDAILLEESYLDILNENIQYDSMEFEGSIDEIYDFVVITNTSYIAKDIDVVKEPFNIYVSGIDTYGEISSISRSDVNMIISVNPDTKQILVTSVPRDYYVKLHGKSGYRDKLTHAGLYGTDMSIKTLEDLFDIEINYYVKVNFSSVIDIVDAIGGIEVYSDYAFTSMDNYSYTAGYNKLNGEEALSFARERKAFVSGDRQRVKNQQAVFKAIFNKCTSKEIVTKFAGLLESLRGSFVTNMPTARITSLVRMQLANNYSWNIVTNSLEGSDDSNYTYSSPNYKCYVMLPDDESVLYSKKLIDNVIRGKNLKDNSLVDDSQMVGQIVDDNSGKLQVRLARKSVTIIEGDEYVYHGYSATYDGENITDDSKIKESFSIEGETFDDYRELVRYITYNLECGNYTIIYNISYKGETQTVQQNVVIIES